MFLTSYPPPPILAPCSAMFNPKYGTWLLTAVGALRVLGISGEPYKAVPPPPPQEEKKACGSPALVWGLGDKGPESSVPSDFFRLMRPGAPTGTLPVYLVTQTRCRSFALVGSSPLWNLYRPPRTFATLIRPPPPPLPPLVEA